MPQQLQPENTGHFPGPASFEATFRAHCAGLCEFVYAYVRSREIAQELVQDLFLRLWELQGTATAPPLTKPYLYTAARNRALRYLRHHRVEARWEARAAVEAERAAPGADEELRYGEVAEGAARAIESLPERCRLVFTLSRHQHLTYAEIAKTLDISISTVETQMWRALKILRAKLSPYLLVAIALLR